MKLELRNPGSPFLAIELPGIGQEISEAVAALSAKANAMVKDRTEETPEAATVADLEEQLLSARRRAGNAFSAAEEIEGQEVPDDLPATEQVAQRRAITRQLATAQEELEDARSVVAILQRQHDDALRLLASKNREIMRAVREELKADAEREQAEALAGVDADLFRRLARLQALAMATDPSPFGNVVWQETALVKASPAPKEQPPSVPIRHPVEDSGAFWKRVS